MPEAAFSSWFDWPLQWFRILNPNWISWFAGAVFLNSSKSIGGSDGEVFFAACGALTKRPWIIFMFCFSFVCHQCSRPNQLHFNWESGFCDPHILHPQLLTSPELVQKHRATWPSSTSGRPSSRHCTNPLPSYPLPNTGLRFSTQSRHIQSPSLLARLGLERVRKSPSTWNRQGGAPMERP